MEENGLSDSVEGSPPAVVAEALESVVRHVLKYDPEHPASRNRMVLAVLRDFSPIAEQYFSGVSKAVIALSISVPVQHSSVRTWFERLFPTPDPPPSSPSTSLPFVPTFISAKGTPLTVKDVAEFVLRYCGAAILSERPVIKLTPRQDQFFEYLMSDDVPSVLVEAIFRVAPVVFLLQDIVPYLSQRFPQELAISRMVTLIRECKNVFALQRIARLPDKPEEVVRALIASGPDLPVLSVLMSDETLSSEFLRQMCRENFYLRLENDPVRTIQNAELNRSILAEGVVMCRESGIHTFENANEADVEVLRRLNFSARRLSDYVVVARILLDRGEVDLELREEALRDLNWLYSFHRVWVERDSVTGGRALRNFLAEVASDPALEPSDALVSWVSRVRLSSAQDAEVHLVCPDTIPDEDYGVNL